MVDVHMNAEPLIPLPKKNTDKPLNIRQLMGLWLIWGISITAGILVFLGEFLVGIRDKRPKNLSKKKGTSLRKIQEKIGVRAAQNIESK